MDCCTRLALDQHRSGTNDVRLTKSWLVVAVEATALRAAEHDVVAADGWHRRRLVDRPFCGSLSQEYQSWAPL